MSLAALRTTTIEVASLLTELHSSTRSAVDDVAVEAVAVGVWNRSVQEKSAREPCREKTVARLRGIALILNEFATGSQATTNVDVRTRLLRLAVATGKAFADVADAANADAVFARAARYALSDSDSDSPALVDALAKDSALLLVFQAELLCSTDPDSPVAFMLINRACAPRFLEKLTIREIDVIIGTCTRLSKMGDNKNNSIQWLKIALNLLESIYEVLLTMASEYVILESMEIADKISTELIQVPIQSSGFSGCTKLYIFQKNTTGLIALAAIQIKLKVLSSHAVSDPEEYSNLATIIQSRISLTNASTETITLFLSILHSVAPFNVAVALSLADWLITQNANIPDKTSLFEKVFLSKIHMLTAPGSVILKEDAITGVKEVIQSVGVGAKGGSVSKDTARMAQLVVWKCGENAMLQHLFQDAVDWFLVALKLVTGDQGDDRNVAILLRKLALSYVQLKLYPEALDACNKAANFKEDLNSISTLYIKFLIYLEQGITNQAEECLAEMAKQLNDAGDKEKVLSFLLGAMDRSFKCGNQIMLRRILQTVLLYNEFEDVEFWRRTMLVIIRCLIRLSIAADVEEIGVERYKELLKYVETAIKSLELWKTSAKGTIIPELEAEISWMGKTCWNLGLRSCKDYPALSARFFCHAANAMKLEEVKEVESIESLTNRKICIYIALLGELEVARASGEGGQDHIRRARTLFHSLMQMYATMSSSMATKDQIYFHSVVLEYELILLEYEVLGLHQECVVDSVRTCLSRATEQDFPLESFQRMADLSLRMNPPSGVVFHTVATALDAMMKKDTEMNLDLFGQWFRLMVSSSRVDGPKLPLYQQALNIIRSTGASTMYPVKEIGCSLLGKSFNASLIQYLIQITFGIKGITVVIAGDKTSAIAWCEMAFKFAEFLPEKEFGIQIEQMREIYADIMEE
ncbi:Testis-expressed protein 11 [Rhizoclosmatium sp. JEL0117]|nr:Testis-expressed protein 11 [Rhizoclosmatium sp. JEL0117]